MLILGDGQITGTLWEDPYTGGGAYIGGRAVSRNNFGKTHILGEVLTLGDGQIAGTTLSAGSGLIYRV